MLGMCNLLDRVKQRLNTKLALRPPSTAVSGSQVMENLLKHVQHFYRHDEKSTTQLSPFIDHAGIIRVGGRLSRSQLPFAEIHPIIIPRESPVVRLIVAHHHEKVLHQGRVITQAAIRSAGIYIVNLRGIVSSYIRSCPRCVILRQQPLTPEMADLPA